MVGNGDKNVNEILEELETKKPDVTFIVKDSGKRQEFSTGSVRDIREGKGRFDLVPAIPIQRLAILYEKGAKKYGERNWEKGQPLSRFMDSALRHLNNYQCGDRVEDHITAACFNLFGFIYTEEMVKQGKLPKELNDIPESK